jgi:hypothetical protein
VNSGRKELEDVEITVRIPQVLSNLGFKIFEIDNKNNRINYINDLKLLSEKYRNSFCDIILVKK